MCPYLDTDLIVGCTESIASERYQGSTRKAGVIIMELTKLIVRAPWREAVTYRETWPHEYVVIKKDKQELLLAAVCERFCAGEGVNGRFFSMKNRYLFIGYYKYWLMTPCHEIDLEKDDYVLNRALIYRDRGDFLIRDGDDGRRDPEIDADFGIGSGNGPGIHVGMTR